MKQLIDVYNAHFVPISVLFVYIPANILVYSRRSASYLIKHNLTDML